MDIQAKCPYCKENVVVNADPGIKGEKAPATQTCPNCQASIDTKLLLALGAGGYGAPEIRPEHRLHAK